MGHPEKHPHTARRVGGFEHRPVTLVIQPLGQGAELFGGFARPESFFQNGVICDCLLGTVSGEIVLAPHLSLRPEGIFRHHLPETLDNRYIGHTALRMELPALVGEIILGALRTVRPSAAHRTVRGTGYVGDVRMQSGHDLVPKGSIEGLGRIAFVPSAI